MYLNGEFLSYSIYKVYAIPRITFESWCTLMTIAKTIKFLLTIDHRGLKNAKHQPWILSSHRMSRALFRCIASPRLHAISSFNWFSPRLRSILLGSANRDESKVPQPDIIILCTAASHQWHESHQADRQHTANGLTWLPSLTSCKSGSRFLSFIQSASSDNDNALGLEFVHVIRLFCLRTPCGDTGAACQVIPPRPPQPASSRNVHDEATRPYPHAYIPYSRKPNTDSQRYLLRRTSKSAVPAVAQINKMFSAKIRRSMIRPYTSITRISAFALTLRMGKAKCVFFLLGT